MMIMGLVQVVLTELYDFRRPNVLADNILLIKSIQSFYVFSFRAKILSSM